MEPATALVLGWIAAVGLTVHADPLLATLVMLGLGGAFIAGLMGVGGAVVVIPLLVYVPPALHTGQLSMHDVSSIAMVQVLAAAASGVAGHWRNGHVDARVVKTLGSGMMIGSFAGAIGSRWVPGSALQGIFASMAAVAAVMIITYRAPHADAAPAVMPRQREGLGFVVALLVGLLAGAVGAGGVFLLAPVMLLVLRIPVHVVVGSSLGIALLSAVSGVGGKLLTGQVPGWPALALVAGALPGAQLGAAAGAKLNPRHVRFALAALVTVIAARMWWDLLVRP